jgi:hypothetical protein
MWIPLVSEEKGKDTGSGCWRCWAVGRLWPWAETFPTALSHFPIYFLFFCFSFVIFAKQFQIDFK